MKKTPIAAAFLTAGLMISPTFAYCNPCAARKPNMGRMGSHPCSPMMQNPCAAAKRMNPCMPCMPCAPNKMKKMGAPCNPCTPQRRMKKWANPCAPCAPHKPNMKKMHPCAPCGPHKMKNPCSAHNWNPKAGGYGEKNPRSAHSWNPKAGGKK